MEALIQELERRTMPDVSKYKKEIIGRAKWYKDLESLQTKKNAKFLLELYQKYGEEVSLENYELLIGNINNTNGYYLRQACRDIADGIECENNFNRGKIMNLAIEIEKELANSTL